MNLAQARSHVQGENPATQPISEAAAARGITQLVHFTPLENIIGMLSLGALLPRRTLLEKAEVDQVTHLRDYLCLNDKMRLDYRTDCLNLSIQHPNSYLFSRFRSLHTACDLWVVLFLEPALLDIPGTVFTVGNAASSAVRSHGTGEELAAFEALFAESVETRFDRGPTSRRPGLAACYPTDIQAEVLLPHEVPLDEIVAFAVENEEHAARLKALFRVSNYADTAEKVVVNPALFSSTRSL